MGARGKMRPVDNSELERWRCLAAIDVLHVLAVHVQVDRDYRPRPPSSTVRVHTSTSDGDYELLVTGAKWYDTRAQKGGGGAIDLVMHLFNVGFRQACRRLEECSL